MIKNNNYTIAGKRIFLYNVGTGRFIIEGGNWGMEGRLFHETFGRPMELLYKKIGNDKYGIIKSGITLNNDKNLFGCNAPGAFHTQKNWTNYDQYSFSIMMDARKGTPGCRRVAHCGERELANSPFYRLPSRRIHHARET